MTSDATPPQSRNPAPDAGAGPPRFREYQDAHYHDEDEPVPNNDLGPGRKLPGKRTSRVLPRRRYEQED